MNIQALAEQAGIEGVAGHVKALTRFAELVENAAREDEREECAKTAEDKRNYFETDCGIDVATDIADAIRARSKA
jgi:hypothetical protein